MPERVCFSQGCLSTTLLPTSPGCMSRNSCLGQRQGCLAQGYISHASKGCLSQGCLSHGCFPQGSASQGVFRKGVFHRGVLRSGGFRRGVFHKGVFRRSVFRRGVVREGVCRKINTMYYQSKTWPLAAPCQRILIYQGVHTHISYQCPIFWRFQGTTSRQGSHRK